MHSWHRAPLSCLLGNVLRLGFWPPSDLKIPRHYHRRDLILDLVEFHMVYYFEIVFSSR